MDIAGTAGTALMQVPTRKINAWKKLTSKRKGPYKYLAIQRKPQSNEIRELIHISFE